MHIKRLILIKSTSTLGEEREGGWVWAEVVGRWAADTDGMGVAGSCLLLFGGGETSNNKPCLERRPFTSSVISVFTLRSFDSRERRSFSSFSHWWHNIVSLALVSEMLCRGMSCASISFASEQLWPLSFFLLRLSRYSFAHKQQLKPISSNWFYCGHALPLVAHKTTLPCGFHTRTPRILGVCLHEPLIASCHPTLSSRSRRAWPD